MVELIDIYDESKNNTGKVKKRHEQLENGNML